MPTDDDFFDGYFPPAVEEVPVREKPRRQSRPPSPAVVVGAVAALTIGAVMFLVGRDAPKRAEQEAKRATPALVVTTATTPLQPKSVKPKAKPKVQRTAAQAGEDWARAQKRKARRTTARRARARRPVRRAMVPRRVRPAPVVRPALPIVRRRVVRPALVQPRAVRPIQRKEPSCEFAPC